MVGIISLSLPTILERIAFAAACGVRTFQFSLPSWGPLNDHEMRRFFAEICGAFPDLAFLHYNLMRTGRLVRPQEYAELAAAHPNLVATKYGAGDPETVAGLLHYAPAAPPLLHRARLLSRRPARRVRAARLDRGQQPGARLSSIFAPAPRATTRASPSSIATSPA